MLWVSRLGFPSKTHTADLQAVAFGMWWMTIPHIAIISGLLLAGNNPNTLEGIVGKKTPNPPRRKWCILELVYESRYRPAWIWHRGRNKRIWAIRLQKTYHTSRFDNLKDKIAIRAQVWISIFVLAFGLIVIPSTLAFPDFVLHSKGRNQLPLNDFSRLHALPILPHLTLDLEYPVDRLNS